MINGQWIGLYTGSNTGTLVVELDDIGTHYEGRAYAYDSLNGLPAVYAFFSTPDKSDFFRLSLPVQPLHPLTLEPTAWENISISYPGVNFPTNVQATLALKDDELYVEATSNIETQLNAVLPRSQAGQASDYKSLPDVTSWNQFKGYVSRLPPNQYLFRGQKKPVRLRTSFHRTGRADISRFLSQDIRTLHRHLSAPTAHLFNLTIPDENGAFFSLVQHHGYPTPLLDLIMAWDNRDVEPS